MGISKMQSRQSPHQRASAGSREFNFYVSRSADMDKRYMGKHIAIVGERIAASGKSPLEVYKRAKKLYPKSKPLLAYIPKGETLVLIIG